MSYTDKFKECVACKKEFSPEDDMVVCPECGAPHHRECWQAEGHCHYEVAHGTDLQWHPKEEEPSHEPDPAPPSHSQPPQQNPVMVINGIATTRCQGCGKFVPCRPEETRCSRCGHTIPPYTPPAGFTVPVAPMDSQTANEPIDHANVGKFARMVMHKQNYYIPRFKQLKKQGTGTVSWNWAAAFLAPYWFAYRKCYLWAAFASFIDLLGALLLSPISTQMTAMMGNTAVTYAQVMEIVADILQSNPAYLYLTYGVMLLYVLRGVVFGLFGNYIYKKDCLRRIDKLDALPPEEATAKAFRLCGVSVFAPVVLYYALSIVQNLLLSFI